MSVCVCSVMSNSVQPHALLAARLLCQWNSPGKIIGVGCLFLLQGIFPTQWSNPHLCIIALVGGFFTTALPGKPINWTKCSNQKTLTNIYKNKTLICVAYKKPTSDLETHTEWNWGNQKRYSMQTEIKKKWSSNSHLR